MIWYDTFKTSTSLFIYFSILGNVNLKKYFYCGGVISAIYVLQPIRICLLIMQLILNIEIREDNNKTWNILTNKKWEK